MKTLLLAAFLALAPACFAGRAFPVESDRYASGLFRTSNSVIRRDPTNFVVDLSGRYATCDRVGQKGPITVERKTPDGGSIGGLVDYTQGEGTNAAIVATYIKTILSTWPGRAGFTEQIKKGREYGCSVQPGCKGHVVVACLFSPAYPFISGGGLTEKKALAFTPQQYKLAERILGMKWDRSHFLENLSAKDAECGMIDKASWDFKKTDDTAKKYGLHVSALFGNSRNVGSTPDAMVRVMSKWKKVTFRKLGCSVIPDCDRVGSGMEVVVVCLYADSDLSDVELQYV